MTDVPPTASHDAPADPASNAPAPAATVTAADVARIAALPDPILRNLWITQTYAELAAALGDLLARTGARPVEHTWCSFAVWASATAGQSIRRQELSGRLAELLEGRVQPAVAAEIAADPGTTSAPRLPAIDDVHQLFEESLDTISARLAHGNALVFGELAPLFVAFARRGTAAGPPPGADELAELLAAAAGPGGLDADLAPAFEWYRQALAASDPVERAWAVNAGNVLAVLHEQRRLQDDVAAALDAGPVTIDDWMTHDHDGRPRRPSLLDRVVLRLWDEVATELLMTLRVPGGALRLGRAVPPLADGQPFPSALADVAAGGAAAAPYEQWDRSAHGASTDRHRDWAVLADRMDYIVNLFRSRQQDPSLAAPPFSPAQVADLHAGRVPPPPLLP